MYLNTRHDSLNKALAVFGGDALTSPHRKTDIKVSILPPWTRTLCFSFGQLQKETTKMSMVVAPHPLLTSPCNFIWSPYHCRVAFNTSPCHSIRMPSLAVLSIGYASCLRSSSLSACTSFGWKFMSILFPHGWTLDDICVPIVWHHFVSVASIFCQ